MNNYVDIYINEHGDKYYLGQKYNPYKAISGHIWHRTDGPAFEGINGTKAWYINDKLHRLDGPAIEYANGDKHWYINHKLHRLDGPAIEYASGSKFWFINGKHHRTDGPAIERFDGAKEWYINNEKYTEENFLKHPDVKKSLISSFNCQLLNVYKIQEEEIKKELTVILGIYEKKRDKKLFSKVHKLVDELKEIRKTIKDLEKND